MNTESPVLYVNPNLLRAAFEIIKDKTNKVNEIFNANIMVQPGYLLSEILLQNGKTAYEFPLLNTQIDNGVFPLSLGVNQNDVFIGVKRAIFASHRTATTDVNVEPQTYYNKTIFTAVNTTTPADIQSLFNAIWNYQVGAKTYIQNQQTIFDLDQPLTQQSSANNYPAWSGALIPDMNPYMVVSGKATNVLNYIIKKASFGGNAVDGQGVNCLTWLMRGFTIQNGAGFSRFYTGDLDVEAYYADYLAKGSKALKYDDSFGNLN